jgi:hypothetical protein
MACPGSSNSKKCAKLPLLSVEGCHTRLDAQHHPLSTFYGVFFQGLSNPLKIKIAFCFLMNKRVINKKRLSSKTLSLPFLLGIVCKMKKQKWFMPFETPFVCNQGALNR